MKATINGVTYEGTPEEISRMMLLQHAESKTKKLDEWQKEVIIETLKQRGTAHPPKWMKDISNSGQAPAYLGEYICYNGQ